ncbi:MAG: molybdopterin molybdotransferase MoeA [Actinomycetota bacterium]
MYRPALPWDQARRVASAAAAPLAARTARLDEAVGAVLAEPIVALSDLPPFASAAMDGYAVAGPSPWQLDTDDTRLAGGTNDAPIRAGTAVPIATGAPLPPGADAVLRHEDAYVETALHGNRLYSRDPLTGIPDDTGATVPPGTDVRPQGEECRAGEPLIDAGTIVGPAAVGLAAAAGYDDLDVIPPPIVAVLVVGDELLDRGLPRPGRVRDALGPLVPPWLASLGARANPPIRVPDSRQALLDEIDDSTADVIVTTGSTASGPVDHLHDVLDHLGARWIVDGVQVRPGHPMLLAALPDGRHVVGLPGNPLAAVSGLLTLAAPLIASLCGQPARGLATTDALLLDGATPHPEDTRLVPVQLEYGDTDVVARRLRFGGPAMLRGLALADGMAVIPPGGGERGTRVEVLPLPAIP